MTTDITERWASRDLPVLRYVVAQIDADAGPVRSDQAAEALGMAGHEVEAAFKNLYRGGYVIGASNERTISYFVFDVTERALRETGSWPNEEQIADRLLSFLAQKIDDAPDDETRTRWKRISDAIAGAGREFAIDLAVAMATKSLGA